MNEMSHAPLAATSEDAATAPRTTAQDRLPGDLTPREVVERVVRVDHAGEYGAQRIYAGQLAVLGNTRHGPLIRHMKEQEDVHYETFSRLIGERRVRPTALLPLWNVAGYALGAATALLGYRAAMACTVAVEEAIDEHYAAQHAALGDDEAELRGHIARFREEELEHRDIGLGNEAELAPAYRLMSAVIKAGCKAAIAVSERV
uniref:2-polyprenyl-3-methyl-6-methoxy-1,4-benzoquinol hydroxylase n=1 Tax=Nostoc flagelliforme str. Sunitezuoqi TaxID=676037 RepID=E7DQG2_9NOSO|nr:2-polyprenyl-3-methyl-6-methoxy-1,4-benzoquinol hydroxylase [Nostoc flagelliforme str. Sunitezuoqi]